MSTNKEIIRSSYSQPGFTINWGAIFAGLVLILSVGWLLFALSTATGAVKSIASSGFNIASQAGTDGKISSSSTLSVHPLVGSLKQGITKILAQAQDSSEAQGTCDSTSSSATEKDEQKNQSSDPRDSVLLRMQVEILKK